MKAYFSAMMITLFTACGSKDSSDTSDAGISLEGTWNSTCATMTTTGSTTTTVESSTESLLTFYWERTLTVVGSIYTMQSTAYTDSGCSDDPASASETGTISVGGGVDGLANTNQINFKDEDDEVTYDIAQVKDTVMYLGLMTSTYDGSTEEKRPRALDGDAGFTKEATTSASTSNANCGSGLPADVNYVVSDSDYTTGPDAEDLVCGSYGQVLGTAYSVNFNVADDAATGTGSSNNVNIQFVGPISEKTFDCAITLNDNNGKHFSTDAVSGATCSLKIKSKSSNGISGTFTASGLEELLDTSKKVGSIAGSFTIIGE